MCVNPIRISNNRKCFDATYDCPYLNVPCGHCWQCVTSKQYDLEIRSVSEFQNLLINGGSVWNYTLTYNDSNLPLYLGIPVLKRKDIQDFKKRLKKNFGPLGNKIDVQYCGEYGKEKDRPHWHILIYCRFQPFAPYMYEQVKKAWSHSTKIYNHVTKKFDYTYHEIGYVGLPCKFVDGHLAPFRSENALLDNVHAIRYCVKYTFKSYNFFTVIYNRFYHLLKSKFGLSDNEIGIFEFPDIDGFKFSPVKEHDIYYVSNYFASCYRNPNNLGMSQQQDLDENYISTTIFRNEKNEYITYPISHYLKNKLFHLHCLNPDKSICDSRYTHVWLDYMLNNVENIITKQESLYICNKDIKINSYYDDIKDNHVYVKDVLNTISDFTGLNLHSYLLFRYVYAGRQMLFDLSIPDALKSLQCRNLCGQSNTDYTSFDDDERIKQVDKYLNMAFSSIMYEQYLSSIKKYNDRQNLLAVEFIKLNKSFSPKYIDTLTFENFVNLKNLNHKNVNSNY